MKNRLLWAGLFFCLLTPSFAQDFTVSGYLRDVETGEELLYAAVTVEGTTIGVSTNEYGFYSLTLPSGKYDITYSYVGYQSQTFSLTLNENLRKDVELGAGTMLEEVVVVSEEADQNISSTEMSVATLDIKDAKLIPVLFGEQDILKTIQLLPGVSANSEGSSGFFVRGGDSDQNLILLDEAPVYNASHLLGFFSVFNSDALKDVKLYKGGIPAQYGGRLSSVLDIRMKNGNTKNWTGSGGLGLISSRLTLEGPIQNDKGSIILSGRRTYADLILRLVRPDFSDTQLYFYDFNAKANYKLGESDRLYASGYFGRDIFNLGPVGLNWGNVTGTLRWNHIFNDQLFSNVSFIYSDFDYGFGIDNAGTAIDLSGGIENYALKQDFNWYPNPNNSIQFGWDATYYKFAPGSFTIDSDELENQAGIEIPNQKAIEASVYIDNEQKIDSRLSLYYGLRMSTFSNIGAYDVKTYNEEDEVETITSYGSGEIYNTYFNFEPRFSATYILNPKSSLKASYNRMNQYIHLLSNSNAGSPTDIWVPSSELIKPEVADQVAVGYFRNFNDNQYEFSAETYYKRLDNLVEYEDGAETFLNEDVEAEIEFGQGRAYGLELFLKKKTGRLTGWVSYTLSKSERQFDAINNGEWFSARQDRTHDISVVASYQLTPKLTLSGSWVYFTGDAVTFPVGKYEIDGELQTLYTGRNGDRVPDYHRLDLGLTWVLKDSDKWHSDLNFSVYNVYDRHNTYSIDFRESENNAGEFEAVQTYLFGAVPSITWNFNFK